MDMLNQIFQAGGASAAERAGPVDIVVALAVAFGLMLAVGVVYQRTHGGHKYTQDYVHMLIMLGMLVTVVIMGIAGDASRAFGIFAAFSIIRFRRSVAAARDLAFIFLAMAVGLATGSGEYALAVLTAVMVSAAVVIIARLDLFAPQRPSHILYIRVTPDVDHTRVFHDVFERLLDRCVLLAVESVQAGLMTELSYAVQLRPDADPLKLVAEVQSRNGNNRVRLRTFDVQGDLDDD